MTLLASRALSVRIARQQVVRDLELCLAPGDSLAILGRNGIGKSTLLHTLAGLRPPDAGEVRLAGVPYAGHAPRAAARLRGLLPQGQVDAFPATVLETALAGRHPHLGRWAWESEADRRLAREALAAVGLEDLATRGVWTLSGGERQRLAIATLLCQQPGLYLLDEPLAHLDLKYQLAVADLFARRVRQRPEAVVMVLHDVNLAARYCRRALLLFGDGDWREGEVEQVLDPASLERLYGQPFRVLRDGPARLFLPA